MARSIMALKIANVERCMQLIGAVRRHHTGPQKKPRVVAGLKVGGNRPGPEITDRRLTINSDLAVTL